MVREEELQDACWDVNRVSCQPMQKAAGVSFAGTKAEEGPEVFWWRRCAKITRGVFPSCKEDFAGAYGGHK